MDPKHCHHSTHSFTQELPPVSLHVLCLQDQFDIPRDIGLWRWWESHRLFILCNSWRKYREEGHIQKGRQRSSLMFWGAKFIQFLAALAILPRKTVKNRMSSSFCFKSSWCKSSYSSNRPMQNSSAARNLINSAPQTKAMTFVFSSVFIRLLCVSTTPRHS